MLATEVRPVRCEVDLNAVRALFQDYADTLALDLSYQNFAEELVTLPGAYSPPSGGLWLARDAEGKPLGCVGLRPLCGQVCELKRLYVQPRARGERLGQRLVQAAVTYARSRGYDELRLDTLPDMRAAIGLYESRGFRRIAPYYSPTPAGSVFMALTL